MISVQPQADDTMPLVKVQTSVQPTDVDRDTLLKRLSQQTAALLGKPESYVMTLLEPGLSMTFAGTPDPVCYIELKSIGKLTPDQTRRISQEFCTLIETALGVPAKRTYIEFADAQGYLWGWNGSTFG
jgi:phenylpyruvate tautomerase PptA (4-oxalocrotonate tautomerase family)